MTDAPRWLSLRLILAIHGRLLAEHGGISGIREDLLESAIVNLVNTHVYGETDVFALASAYASAITWDHPFTDGNKRVALTAAGVFLEINGQRLEVKEEDAVHAMLALSTKDMTGEELASWLRMNSHPAGA